MTSPRPLSIGIALALLGSAALLTSGIRLLAQTGASENTSADRPAIRRPEPSTSAQEPTPVPQPTTPAKNMAPAAPAAPASSDPIVPPAEISKPKSTASGAEGRELTEEEAAAAAKAAEAERMNELFPIGRVFQGVKMPSYSGDTLTSVVHADFMRRADDEHLEMEMLEIVNYNAGAPDSRILTDRAIYDMEAKTMRSTTPARIIQKQFEMTGDRLIFDSASRVGHMVGNVKTRIHQFNQFMDAKK